MHVTTKYILLTFVAAMLLKIPVVFAEQILSVAWSDAKHQSVDITVSQHDEDMNACLKSGADVFYRFEMQICTRRRSWFDRCSDSKVATRSLRFAPISETYAVASDLFDDSLPAEKHVYTSKVEAMLDLSTVRGVPAQIKSDETRKQFINLRLKFTCKGQSSVLLDRLSSIITLGIVPTGAADTGWQEFFIQP